MTAAQQNYAANGNEDCNQQHCTRGHLLFDGNFRVFFEPCVVLHKMSCHQRYEQYSAHFVYGPRQAVVIHVQVVNLGVKNDSGQQ